MYCHDEEHTKFESFVRYGSTHSTEIKAATFNPFADLKAKMESKQRMFVSAYLNFLTLLTTHNATLHFFSL